MIIEKGSQSSHPIKPSPWMDPIYVQLCYAVYMRRKAKKSGRVIGFDGERSYTPGSWGAFHS